MTRSYALEGLFKAADESGEYAQRTETHRPHG
jgi:hypothetical protein